MKSIVQVVQNLLKPYIDSNIQTLTQDLTTVNNKIKNKYLLVESNHMVYMASDGTKTCATLLKDVADLFDAYLAANPNYYVKITNIIMASYGCVPSNNTPKNTYNSALGTGKLFGSYLELASNGYIYAYVVLSKTAANNKWIINSSGTMYDKTNTTAEGTYYIYFDVYEKIS